MVRHQGAVTGNYNNLSNFGGTKMQNYIYLNHERNQF